MKITIGECEVNLCSVPAFMGHEEIVLPMLLQGLPEWDESRGLGAFGFHVNQPFQPNDLSNTAVAGYLAGLHHPSRVDLKRFFVGCFPDDWRPVTDIGVALDALGPAYAFFLEKSAAPLQDGFIQRCRFVARNRLSDFHPQADLAKETEQTASAQDILSAFLRKEDILDFQATYGDYFDSSERKIRFGDDEQYSGDYAIWLEGEGVVRAWTRVTYVPK